MFWVALRRLKTAPRKRLNAPDIKFTSGSRFCRNEYTNQRSAAYRWYRYTRRESGVDRGRRDAFTVCFVCIRVWIVAAGTVPQRAVWPEPLRLLRLPRAESDLPRRIAYAPVNHLFVPCHCVVFPCNKASRESRKEKHASKRYINMI